MKRFATWILFMILLASASCTRLHPRAAGLTADPSLTAIDSLLWTQPDSAFSQLLAFSESREVDNLNDFNGHYFHLLLSELLYKNDYAQTNRDELLRSVDYYDSLVAVSGARVDDDLVFLDARAHYIEGVGYYEMDSAVPACREHLRAVELMEERFSEKELTGKKAQFMALAYTRLTILFSGQYLHEQAVFYGKQALLYYNLYEAKPWHVSWLLEEIGVQYDIMNSCDSAMHYYQSAEQCLTDTTDLTYRDIKTHLALLTYKNDRKATSALKRLQEMLALSESPQEYQARCLVIGEVYYLEQQYDSAWHFFNMVFLESESVGSKKQAAERLAEIGKCRGLDSSEYADYLVPFANQNEYLGEIKSQLAEQYRSHLKRDHDIRHRQKIKLQEKLTGLIIGTLVFLFLAYFVFYHVIKHKKKLSETRFSKEKYAHDMAQKALGGRLKKKGETLRLRNEEVKKLQENLDAQQRQTTWSSYDDFINEPICQTILGMFKGVHIKREANINDYQYLRLDKDQLLKLEVAVSKHFDGFGSKLTSLYPRITRNEMNQCLLSLLNFEDVQIAALLQCNYSTINKRSAKLKKAFRTEKTLQSFLREWVL